MTKLKKTTLAAALLSMGLGLGLSSTAVMANGDDDSSDEETVLNDDMQRRGPGTTSGSGDTVEANCDVDPSGNAWQGSTATLKIEQVGSSSTAQIKVKDAVPNTVFTVWLRVKGSGFGGSPLTGGGATPLAPGYALDNMIAYSPFAPAPGNAGTANPTNGFTTDKNGNANWKIDLDFPVIRGAYPFQMATAPTPQGPGIPTAVVNPADGHGGPFMIRVISHCTDQLGHGLSPATREAWFQWP